MSGIKVGDKVVRINYDNCAQMPVGSVWTVIDIEEKYANIYLKDYGCAYLHNFRLVTKLDEVLS